MNHLNQLNYQTNLPLDLDYYEDETNLNDYKKTQK